MTDIQSASQFWCRQPISVPWPHFFSLSDDCRFLDMGHPLLQGDGSVIYCTIASGPCQSSHSWVKVPQNSQPYFTVSSETPPTWSARSSYFYPPGTGWPSYTSGQSVDCLSELDVNLQLTVWQSVLVSGTHLEPSTNFSFSLKFPSDSCGFIIVWRPLWWEGGSIICCTIASGLCKSSHSWVEVPQTSRQYFTVSFETPPTWRARSPYLYPSETGWPSYTPGHWVDWLSKSKSYYNRRLIAQFVLVSCPFWSKWPDVTFIWVTITFIIFHVGRPLWREDGSVICSAMTQAQFQVTL
jgi:hypothetical protein